MCREKCNILVCTWASVYCVMTAGKLEQYYKNTEEWSTQHSGNCLREQSDLLNTMPTVYELIWQLHSNNTYTDSVVHCFL